MKKGEKILDFLVKKKRAYMIFKVNRYWYVENKEA